MAIRRKRAIAPIVIGVLGTAALLTLGSWQVQRLEWKQGLINAIETRMAAPPVALPKTPDRLQDHLLRVEVTGELGTEELHVIHSVKRSGPGYRLVVPMDLPDRKIMVDLGFVVQTRKDTSPRDGSVRWRAGPREDRVVGLLTWPNETDGYTPEPDFGRNIWFARDVEKMAKALGTEPVLVIAEAHPDQYITLPLPPGVDLPNRHLEYAGTWFGMAIVWLFMSIYWLRTEMRRTAE